MRKNSVINAIVIIIATMIVFACVPARQFEDVKAKKESCEAERN